MKTLSILTAGLLAMSASAFAQSETSVVLVHGAFADGSSWNKVISFAETPHRGNSRPAAVDLTKR